MMQEDAPATAEIAAAEISEPKIDKSKKKFLKIAVYAAAVVLMVAAGVLIGRLTSGGASASVSGTYESLYKEGDYLDLKKDGTFEMYMYGGMTTGTYTVEGNIVACKTYTVYYFMFVDNRYLLDIDSVFSGTIPNEPFFSDNTIHKDLNTRTEYIFTNAGKVTYKSELTGFGILGNKTGTYERDGNILTINYGGETSRLYVYHDRVFEISFVK